MEKVSRILVAVRVASPKDNVIAWISFIFSEMAVLGTVERQLGEKISPGS